MPRRLEIKKINDQTINFMNLVENFSRTSTDIAEVCDKAAFYIKDPLKSIIDDFVTDIRLYGNKEKSFMRVEKRLKGCKLQDIFKSFEICEKHEGNFAKIVHDSKKSVMEFDKSITIRRAIIANARADLLSLVFGGGIVMVMLNGFLSGNVLEILTGSYIGIAILIYGIVCGIGILWVMAKGD